MESACVFIDGRYLLKVAKHFFGDNPPTYDINQFGINLAKKQDLICTDRSYYIAPPYQDPKPNPDQRRRKANHDRFVNALNKISGFTVKEGRCQRLSDGYHQKGVDTLITMDLLSVAIKGDVNKIILFACDTDFVPIIKKIKDEFDIKVILYYYSDFVRGSKFSMSNHLIDACSESFLIDKTYFDEVLR